LLTLVASGTAAIGTFPLTLTGTSGTLSAATTMTLTVGAFGFTLGSGGNMTVTQGTSNTAYVFESPQLGFSGNVTLSISGLPRGVTASFNPVTVSEYGSSTVTLTATSAAAAT